MPPRPRIRDDEILEVARAIFLESGADATTASVAARAGVSEALVFKRFGTKERLFELAMTGARPGWVSELDDVSGPLPEQLERLALAMIETMRIEMPRTMMVWSRNPGQPRWPTGVASPPVQGVKILAAWFERQMLAGRMRRCDPELFAQSFSGAIVAHAMRDMTGLAEHMPLATTTFVRGLVDFLWRGVRPPPDGP
jgi:AcrR family transcriptional regulator